MKLEDLILEETQLTNVFSKTVGVAADLMEHNSCLACYRTTLCRVILK